VEKEEKEGEEDKQKQGEVTPPSNPLEEAETSKKRKVSPMKPTSQKNSKESKPKLQTVLTVDEFNFIIATILYASKDNLQIIEAKKESMYDIIEKNLRGVKQALHSIRAVPIVPPPPEEPELGCKPAQLYRIVDVTEAYLCRVQE
jgi:hypothetical protein